MTHTELQVYVDRACALLDTLRDEGLTPQQSAMVMLCAVVTIEKYHQHKYKIEESSLRFAADMVAVYKAVVVMKGGVQ